jgi:hypothetical protein
MKQAAEITIRKIKQNAITSYYLQADFIPGRSKVNNYT